MQAKTRVWITRWLLPFGTISAALLAHIAIALATHKTPNVPYALLYIVAICIAAWSGGYVSGTIACLLSMVFLPALVHHGFRQANIDPSRLALVIGCSLLVSKVASSQKRIREVLHKANDGLERRVQSRTLELEGEIAHRKESEQRLQQQLGRLHLLDHITRAIGERQDLGSIFQVVVRTLEEDLPIDFGVICLYDPGTETLTVKSTGTRDAQAAALGLVVQERVVIGQNGLSRCVRGHLVYEADTSQLDFPFPALLAAAGLRSMVAAPLLSESSVFGVLVVARNAPEAFSSSDCEFLRQLSGHVALAAHQAQIYDALRQAYDDLRRTQQSVMEQERLRALGQMASGIAHDINNALSPVALYTESLLDREPGLSTRTREYLMTTQRSIEDVAQTVARLREFYRKPEPMLPVSTIDVNLIVSQVLDLTRARWSDMPQQRGIVIQVRTDLEANLPAIVGIESEIREALTNLVFNAVDAMPEGGTLTFRTKSAGTIQSASRVHVEVLDTGVGMDDATRRRCLEPFFTTKGERGTGLGLAMVYGVAQRHDAEIQIESTVGVGSLLRLDFPVARRGASSSIPAHRAPISLRMRVLVIDDDPLIVKSLRDILESDGHLVVIANGGREGIEIVKSSVERGEGFGVVITDLGMPGIDGRQVAGAVKKLSPNTPVILLTGWGQRLVDDDDVPANVDRVLNKPPRLNQLRTALAELALVDLADAKPVEAAVSYAGK